MESSSAEPANQLVEALFSDVPVQSAGELACGGIFDTDDELDDFIAHVYATRRTIFPR